MLDTIKRAVPAVQILLGLFHCTAVDPEGAAQATAAKNVNLVHVYFFLYNKLFTSIDQVSFSRAT